MKTRIRSGGALLKARGRGTLTRLDANFYKNKNCKKVFEVYTHEKGLDFKRELYVSIVIIDYLHACGICDSGGRYIIGFSQ
mgnify:CR=1 FL=1